MYNKIKQLIINSGGHTSTATSLSRSASTVLTLELIGILRVIIDIEGQVNQLIEHNGDHGVLQQ